MICNTISPTKDLITGLRELHKPQIVKKIIKPIKRIKVNTRLFKVESNITANYLCTQIIPKNKPIIRSQNNPKVKRTMPEH